MEGLRSPSAANKWLLLAGGKAGTTTPSGTSGEGGDRCGASRVLHFRTPSGTQYGSFSRVLLWRRATAVVPAFPRRPSPFSAFPSAEKLEKADTEKEASLVQTQTVSGLPLAAAESETARVQNQTAESGSLPMATVKTEQSDEAVQFQTATESLKAGTKTDTTQVKTHVSSESQQIAETDETVQVETHTPNETRTVHVRFMLQKSCEFGEKFLLVGENPILGSWDTDKAIPLEWSEGHVWVADVDLLVEEEIKFKFILQTLSGKIKWQPGPDRVLQTWESTDTIVVAGIWESAVDQKIAEKGNISEDSTGTGTEGESGTENNQAEVADDGNLKNMVGTGEEKPVAQKEDPVLIPGLASLAVASSSTESAPSGESTNGTVDGAPVVAAEIGSSTAEVNVW